MNYFIIALLWTAYCALHSYLISISFTDLLTRLLKKNYAFFRIFYVIISVLLFIPLGNYTNQLDSRIIIIYEYPISIIRYVLITGSLLMFFWAFFVNYDSLTFFGIRQILNIGKKKDDNSPAEFKKKGLLGVMRHPMYFALLIFLWCNVFTYADIVVNAVFTLYIFIGTYLEERKLVLEFGDIYKKYQKEVPMIFPFMKRKSI